MTYDFLLKEQKFAEISKVLTSGNLDGQDLKRWLTEDCAAGETALHKLVRHQPPASLVELLIKTLFELEKSEIALKTNAHDVLVSFESEMKQQCTDASADMVFLPEEAVDRRGRNPLHLAVEAGCKLSVVDRLLSGETCSMPAIAKDAYGRTPLHWACTNPSGGESPAHARSKQGSLRSLFGLSVSSRQDCNKSHCSSASLQTKDAARGKSISDMENMACVICRLTAVYPEAASIKDLDGFTPLDLAILSRASKPTLRFLRQAVKLHEKGQADCESTEETMDLSSDELPIGSLLVLCRNGFPERDDVSSIGWTDNSSVPPERAALI